MSQYLVYMTRILDHSVSIITEYFTALTSSLQCPVDGYLEVTSHDNPRGVDNPWSNLTNTTRLSGHLRGRARDANLPIPNVSSNPLSTCIHMLGSYPFR